MSSRRSFDKTRHIRYFAYCLKELPSAYDKLDTNRLTLVHFCVQALDLLGCLDDASLVNKHVILDWMAKLLVPDGTGYVGGTFLGTILDNDDSSSASYRQPHIAMTYTALCIHVALQGTIPATLDTHVITTHLSLLQQDNGSFTSVVNGSEHDMRFLYCACCISHMCDDWTGVDKARAIAFVQSCRSFDGAFSLLPGQEGHGGSTFCAVASLVLMGAVEADATTTTTTTTIRDALPEGWTDDLIRWCVQRQVHGMQGRPNKLEDTCYSYWIGGTLRLLGRQGLLDRDALRQYVLSCQSPQGGFGKVVGAYPDVLHSFYSMAWMSLSEQRDQDDTNGLRLLNCTLGICQQRADVFGRELP